MTEREAVSPEEANSKAPSEWVTKKRERRLDAILKASATLFAEQGFDGTNFDEVAASVGLRGASLYHYVDSKDDLFLKCVEVPTLEIIGRLNEVGARFSDPRDSLRALFREQVIVQLKDYPEFTAVFFRIQHPDPLVRAYIRDLRDQHFEVFRRSARRIVSGADLESRSIELQLAIGALVHINEWHRPGGPLEVEEFADEVASKLMRILEM